MNINICQSNEPSATQCCSDEWRSPWLFRQFSMHPATRGSSPKNTSPIYRYNRHTNARSMSRAYS